MKRRDSDLCILSLFMLAGCASTAIENTNTEVNTIHLTLAQDQTQSVVLGLNQTLIAEIPSNPTTGYRWELDQRTRERRCYLYKELPYTSSSHDQTQPLRAGAPTIQKWSIKIDPTFPCSTEQLIHWTYSRSWEPPSTQNPTTQILLKPN